MPHIGQTGITIDHDGVRLLGTLFLAAGDGRWVVGRFGLTLQP